MRSTPAAWRSSKPTGAAKLEERLGLGLGRPPPDGLIFTDRLGEPVKPDSFSQMFDRQVAKLDPPRIRLPTCDIRRGACAAKRRQRENGSERLGHAGTAFTIDVHAASVPALEEETAATVAGLLD